MKIITVGDIHGREFWKDIEHEEMDHFVFIGDYFDSYDEGFSADEEIKNFQDIVELKRENPEMISLLIGNHDYHYLSGVEQRYSRYQADEAMTIREALEQASDVLQMCYAYKNVVFTHAGLSKTWCKENEIDLDNIEQSVNNKFTTDQNAFSFNYELGDESGNNKKQSPIWIRPEALLSDKVDGFHQVVGHTQQKVYSIQDGIAFIDVPGSLFVMEDVDDYWGL